MGLFRRLFGADDDADHEDKPADRSTTQEVAPVISDAETVPGMKPVPAPTTPSYPSGGIGATRQLNTDRFIMPATSHMTFGRLTDVGLQRTNNEDSAFAFFSTSRSTEDMKDFGIFVVADGMGGHQKGEVASSIAIRTVAAEVTNQVYLHLLAGSDMAAMPPISEILTEAIQKANTEVRARIPEGGGTTCTAVLVLGDRAYIGHVGDSRAYLITKDNIEQITRDHSTVQRLVELGKLTPEEAATHERGNELYRALGFNDHLDVDVSSKKLPARSRLLICSDGLWNLVPEADMVNIVMNNHNPQEACNELIDRAKTLGGTDNITAIVLQAN